MPEGEMLSMLVSAQILDIARRLRLRRVSDIEKAKGLTEPLDHAEWPPMEDFFPKAVAMFNGWHADIQKLLMK